MQLQPPRPVHGRPARSHEAGQHEEPAERRAAPVRQAGVLGELLLLPIRFVLV